MSTYKKLVLVIVGTLLVFLGFLGVVIPLLPTTPFLLLAVACYAKSSQKLYEWLLNNKLMGKYIRSYYEGRGIPLPAKVVAISMLWVTIGCSAIFIVPVLIVKIVLFLIAVGVTIHILSVKTYGY